MNQKEFFELVETKVQAFVEAGGKLQNGVLIRSDGNRCAVGCLALIGENSAEVASRLKAKELDIYNVEAGFDDGFLGFACFPYNEAYKFGYELGVKYRPAP